MCITLSLHNFYNLGMFILSVPKIGYDIYPIIHHTSSTVDTYLVSLDPAQCRSIPFRLEMIGVKSVIIVGADGILPSSPQPFLPRETAGPAAGSWSSYSNHCRGATSYIQRKDCIPYWLTKLKSNL